VRLLVEHLDDVPKGEGPFEVTLSDRVERCLLPGEGRGPAEQTVGLGPIEEVALSPGQGCGRPGDIRTSQFRRGTIGARGPLPVAGARFVELVETDLLPIVMFGAGHVGRAIAERAAGLPIHLAWYDSRPEMADTGGVVLADEAEMAAQAAEAREGSAVLVMTHDHGLDYRLTAAALGGRARFVGLIGSKTKRARFLKRLAAEGVDAARLTCPIGLPGIAGREPEVIAIAALAQLLMLKNPA